MNNADPNSKSVKFAENTTILTTGATVENELLTKQSEAMVLNEQT